MTNPDPHPGYYDALHDEHGMLLALLPENYKTSFCIDVPQYVKRALGIQTQDPRVLVLRYNGEVYVYAEVAERNLSTNQMRYWFKKKMMSECCSRC